MAEDSSYSCEYVVVDPFPSRAIRRLPGIACIAKRVEQMPLETFTELGSGDILFIDSTHVLKLGSDVQFEYLEILPRLRPGVVVHVHDIFLPAEYPREWLYGGRYWSEQYLLQAFLAFNSAFQVLWSGAVMHRHRPEALMAAFPSYDAASLGPGSFWMRRLLA
jgi:hypothetical protein